MQACPAPQPSESDDSDYGKALKGNQSPNKNSENAIPQRKMHRPGQPKRVRARNPVARTARRAGPTGSDEVE